MRVADDARLALTWPAEGKARPPRYRRTCCPPRNPHAHTLSQILHTGTLLHTSATPREIFLPDEVA